LNFALLLEVLGDAVDESLKTILPGVLDITVETAAHFLFEDLNDDATELLK